MPSAAVSPPGSLGQGNQQRGKAELATGGQGTAAASLLTTCSFDEAITKPRALGAIESSPFASNSQHLQVI